MLSLILAAILAGSPAALCAEPEDGLVELLGSREREVDSDGDGKADLFRSFDSSGKLTRVTYDLNADGKHDEEVSFEASGSVRLKDNDFDGQFDERVTETYSGRSLVRQTTESKAGAAWKVRNERSYVPDRRSFRVIDYGIDGEKTEERLEPADLR